MDNVTTGPPECQPSAPYIQHISINAGGRWLALCRTSGNIIHVLLPPLELHQPTVVAVQLPVEPSAPRYKHTQSLTGLWTLNWSIIVVVPDFIEQGVANKSSVFSKAGVTEDVRLIIFLVRYMDQTQDNQDFWGHFSINTERVSHEKEFS